MRKLDRSLANYLLLLYGGLMIIGLLLVIFPQWSLMAVTWLLGFGALISGGDFSISFLEKIAKTEEIACCFLGLFWGSLWGF